MAYSVDSCLFASLQEESAKGLLAEFNLGCTDSNLDHNYRVYVATFLEYGGNAARKRYEKMLLDTAPALVNASASRR